MNNLYALKQWVPAKVFAVFTIVSLVLSALPASFLTAHAATALSGPDSATLTLTGDTSYEAAAFDASVVDIAYFAFDFDGTTADNGDSIEYGWKRTSDSTENVLGTIDFKNGQPNPADIGSVLSVLPLTALVGDLIVYIKISDGMDADDDSVSLTNIEVFGETEPAGTRNTDDTAYDNPTGSIDFICHYDSDNKIYQKQPPNLSSIVKGQGHGDHNKDIIPPFWYQFDSEDPINLYLGKNWDTEGMTLYRNDCKEPVVDVCPNLDGDQASVPDGYTLDKKEGICVPIQPPVCKIGENLLDNGSFEEPEVTNDSLWQKMASVFGWTIEKVSDDSSTTLELMRGWSGNEAAHGEQYAELDGDHSTKVSQTVDTDEGATYELKWAFAPRHGIDAEQNQLAVLVDGSVVATEGPDTAPAGLGSGDWKRSGYVFKAGSDETTITFSDAGPSDSFGTFLDDAALCFVSEADPEEPEICSYEGKVISTSQGLTNGGAPVADNRSLVSAVEAGVADYTNFFGKEENDWQVNPLDFYSLGIEGELVYEFTDRIAVDQPGDDIAVWEITGGPADEQAAESADVYVSQNGVDFVLAGSVTGDGSVDIAGTGLDFVKFVKLVDTSNGVQGNNGDGYDLDGITIIDGSCDDYATVHTTKIVCEDEADLPNWGGGAANLTETTATDWISDEHPSCEIVDGWEFEWAPKGTSDPGDTLVGPAGGDWTTFTGSTMIPASEFEGDGFFWMREVLQEGYIPFTHGPEGNKNTDDYSAEFYCHKDVLNYDNYDRLDGPQAGGEYYCVGWNVPVEKPPVCEMTIVSDDTNYVVERDDNAVELSFVHPNWVQSLVDSFWIWGDDGPVDPSAEETQNFVKNFGVNPAVTVTDATLRIASDNQFEADLNGSFNVDDNDGNNFSALQDYDVTSDILAGNNTLAVEVVNNSLNTQNPEANPAGLYYELVITGEGAEECGAPYEPPPAPYCGDGEVNQAWEQCDGDDVAQGETCTDYCLIEDQCSMEQLVKIDFTKAPDSVSFDETIIIGDGKTAPAGHWFHLDDVENGDLHDLATNNEGLALSNDGSELGFAVWGGNAGSKFDYVNANIHFLGMDLGVINDTNAVINWPLEDQNSNYPDIFDKDGNEKITMEWYLTTGGDAASVAYTQGEKYNCEECLATVEARIVPNSLGTAGDGDLSDEIVLGDAGYTTVGFGEWFPISLAPAPGESAVMIDDPNTVTNFDSPGDKPGLFVSREDGTVKVALYGEHNPGGATNNEWIDARIEVRDAEITNFEKLTGQFKFENHNGNNQPSDDYDEATADSTGVDFKMWVDTASDGFKFDINDEEIAFCEDDTEDTIIIDGFKYEGKRMHEEFVRTLSFGPGLSGWTIELYDDGELVATTTTDVDGHYSFEVPEGGDYTVHEVMQDGWFQMYAVNDGHHEYPGEGLAYCEIGYEYDYFPAFAQAVTVLDDIVPVQKSDHRCSFYNGREILHTIDGFKREEGTGAGLSGWTIQLWDEGGLVDTAVTNGAGYYSFSVPAGDYEVREVMQTDWYQTDITAFGGTATGDQDVNYCMFEINDYLYSPVFSRVTEDAFVPQEQDQLELGRRCDFVNEEEDEPGNPTTSTRVQQGGNPTVAGASTDFCPFLLDYMQISWENDTWEVTKLQMFLNMIMGETLGLTGFFDRETDEAVKRFQARYHSEVIAPWFERGIVPHNDPTGFVYKTTKWKINDIVCPGVEPYPSFDGEDLSSNIDED